MIRSCLVLSLLVLTACDRSAPPAPAAQTASAAPASAAPATAAAAAAAAAAESATAPKIDGSKAKKLVSEGAKLIDVRSAAEYADKHVDGAENVPVDTIGEKDLGPKDKAIVVYCQSGRRSARAAASLRSRGYTNVYDLGGMSSWDQ